MTRQRYVGVVGALGALGLSAGATAHTFAQPLTYANGVTVPTLAGGNDIQVSILDSTGNDVVEVVLLTAYDSATGTASAITRAREGTAAVAHAAGRPVTVTAYPSDFTGLGGGGGGGFTPTTRPLVDPTVQAWSWVNQGVAAVANQGAAILLSSPAETADSWHWRAKAVPAKPYSVIIHHIPALFPVNYMGVGFGWRNSASGAFALAEHRGGTPLLDSGWAASGFALTASYGTWPVITPFPWFKLTDDVTNRRVYVSMDGYTWFLYHSIATNTNVTPDQLIFGVQARNASGLPVGVMVDSWEEA